jgi:hypothetical protein
MTPKEKAKTLINNFYNLRGMDWDMSISCSLIAVSEILSLGKKTTLETLEYYLEVKAEIEKL